MIVAQERMANNFVYLFKKKDQNKYSWCAEIRSYLDRSNSQYSGVRTFKIMLLKKNKSIVCSLPKMCEYIPIIVLFRALGYEPDKDILEHICYDLKDK